MKSASFRRSYVRTIEHYADVTPVVGAAFGREPWVKALFADEARSYGCRANSSIGAF